MVNHHGETYMYTFEAVREKAPSASGVYTLFTPRRWVFVRGKRRHPTEPVPTPE